jgi:transposase InsO family protein
MIKSYGSGLLRTVLHVASDLLRFVVFAGQSRSRLAAENLFLRKQLALYVERQAKARRPDDATRITLVILSDLIDWRRLLTIVQPETLLRWHRKGFRLFWRCRSRPQGRPRVPADLRRLIRDMAEANATWGEERIAAELLLKLGIRVSPRTVRRYMPHVDGSGNRTGSQRWTTFVRNHAGAVLACDFFAAVTVRFRLLYVFVVLDVGTRRIIHWNVTGHPTASWTLQQFRIGVPGDPPHRFVIHDRDRVFSQAVDAMLTSTGLAVLKTPVRSPQANAYCERLIGTIRRECLDWVIPLSEQHVRRVLHAWVAHYNRGRPHASLGPGIPEPASERIGEQSHRHQLPIDHRVTATPILGGLHHEYRLERVA